MPRRKLDLWKIVGVVLTIVSAVWYLSARMQSIEDKVDYLQSDSAEIKLRVMNVERTQRDIEKNETWMVDTEWEKLHGGKVISKW